MHEAITVQGVPKARTYDMAPAIANTHVGQTPFHLQGQRRPRGWFVWLVFDFPTLAITAYCMTASQPGLSVLRRCSSDQLKVEAGGVRFTRKDALGTNRYISLTARRQIRLSYDTGAELRFQEVPRQILLFVMLLRQLSLELLARTSFELATQATFSRLAALPACLCAQMHFMQCTAQATNYMQCSAISAVYHLAQK